MQDDCVCVCARSDGSLSSLYLGIEAMDSRIVLADCSWSVVEWCIEDESGRQERELFGYFNCWGMAKRDVVDSMIPLLLQYHSRSLLLLPSLKSNRISLYSSSCRCIC
jgi:hypothetical protein